MAALDVDKVKARATAFLKGFSPSQLVIIGLLTLVAAVGGVTFLKWVTAPTYGVLLAGMDPKDASAVVAKLTADGVPYTLAAGGATVMIPTSSLDAERLAVASAGLPAGSTDAGWAAFDKQGLTSSSFQQQVAYQRALESTLATSVGQISGVRAAEVHLALPEKKLFTDDQKPARASVLVTTDGSLGQDAVDAMTHLVASSVPDLQAADVTVTDSSGRLLSGDGQNGAAGTDRALQARTQLETGLESRVGSMFDQLLGPGHAVVRVNAEMDTANRTVDSETFDDKKKAVLSETSSVEKYSTPPGSTGIGGTLGVAGTQGAPTAAPVPSPAATPGATADPGYSKTQTSLQNGVSRVVEHQVVTAGGVKRLTVAVAVDRNAPNAPSPAELQALVSNAVGLDPARGDTISVTTPSFLQQPTATATGAGATAGARSITALVPQVLGGLLLLLVALGLLRTVRRGVATDLSAAEVTAALDRTGGRAVGAGTAQGALPAGSIPAPRGADEEPDVMSLLDDDQEVAGMLRGWLTNVGGGDQ